jgi:hypothetical protein
MCFRLESEVHRDRQSAPLSGGGMRRNEGGFGSGIAGDSMAVKDMRNGLKQTVVTRTR